MLVFPRHCSGMALKSDLLVITWISRRKDKDPLLMET